MTEGTNQRLDEYRKTAFTQIKHSFHSQSVRKPSQSRCVCSAYRFKNNYLQKHANIPSHAQPAVIFPLLSSAYNLCWLLYTPGSYTHTHSKPYASRLFSIKQAFAHCSPGVSRSTSSLPDRLNMERMAHYRSRQCVHRHRPHVYTDTNTLCIHTHTHWHSHVYLVFPS